MAKYTDSRFNQKFSITSAAILGSSTGYPIFKENILHLITLDVNSTNTIDIEVKLEHEDSWEVLDTITGEDQVIIDITEYDYVRFNCTTFSGLSTAKFVGSGFFHKKTQAVTIPSEVEGDRALSAHTSVFGFLSTAGFIPDFAINFQNDIPTNLIETDKSASATITQVDAKMQIQTSVTGTYAKAISRKQVKYRAFQDSVFAFTVIYKMAPEIDGEMMIGPLSLDGNDGYQLGFSGPQFGLFRFKDGVKTFTPSTDFTHDKLDGGRHSLFKQEGKPIAYNKQKGIVFIVQFGWLGFAPPGIYCITPEGYRILIHRVYTVNNEDTPHLHNPNLHLQSIVNHNNETKTLELDTSSWAGGYLGTIKENVIDAGNTTSTPLSANDSFVGIPISFKNDSHEYSVAFYADQDSKPNGMIMEYTFDQITWFSIAGGFDYKAGTLRTFNVPPFANEFRVRFENNATLDQTEFYIVTYKLALPSKSTISRLDAKASADKSAETVKSAILAFDVVNNEFIPVQSSPSGSFQVAQTDRPYEVRNRQRVEIVLTRTSLTATPLVLYTVPANFRLHIDSLIITYLNDVNTIGEWYIRDNGTTIIPFLATTKSVGSAAPSQAPAPSLPTPHEFDTNLELVEVSGDIIVTVSLLGYIEPI